MAKLIDCELKPYEYEYPEGTEEIKTKHHFNDTFLNRVSFPKTLKSIGKDAFRGCTLLSEINLPYGLEYIGQGAFAGCKSLKYVDIPPSVKCISLYAFAECENLKSVDFSEGIISICDCAFKGCTSLHSVVIPGSVVDIGLDAFDSINYVKLNEGIKEIHCCAFSNSNIKHLKIPASTNIKLPWYEYDSTVFDIKSLRTFEVDDNNACFSSKDGILYNKNKSVVVRMPIQSPINNLVLPQTIKTISREAFKGCKNLRTIRLPKGLSKLENFAFCDCTSLTEIHIEVEKVESICFYCRDVDDNGIQIYIDESYFSKETTDVCTLFVPPGTRWAYRHHPVFGQFKNIEIEF